MGKYSDLEHEFTEGFLRGKWKSATQFAIQKGIGANGQFKADSVGWKNKAKAKQDRLAREAEEKATEMMVEQKAVEYLGVYENLGAAAMSASKIVKLYFESIESVCLGLSEEDGDRNWDARELNAAMDTGLKAHALLKKIYTGDDLPISAEMKHKIEEARQIKKAEDTGPKLDVTEGMSRDEVQAEITKLQS